mgnify:CR=1 FL=1
MQPSTPPRGQCACGVVCAARGASGAQGADWAANLGAAVKPPPAPRMVLRWGPSPSGPPAASSRDRPAVASKRAAPRYRTSAAGGWPTSTRRRQLVRGAVVSWKREQPRVPRGHVRGARRTPGHRQPSSVAVSSRAGRLTARRVGHEGPQHWASALLFSASSPQFLCPHHGPLPGPPVWRRARRTAHRAAFWPRLPNCRNDGGAPDGCPTVRRGTPISVE